MEEGPLCDAAEIDRESGQHMRGRVELRRQRSRLQPCALLLVVASSAVLIAAAAAVMLFVTSGGPSDGSETTPITAVSVAQPQPPSPLPAQTKARVATCQRLLERDLGLQPEVALMADETNFGIRHPRNDRNQVIPSAPSIIVLHETVIAANRAIKKFQTRHPNDNDQSSYHMLVELSGRTVRLVRDKDRAFGAGMSAFGDFSVKTRAGLSGSVNNVALHLSLESPEDGRPLDTTRTPPEIKFVDSHSGYTDEQYKVAAARVLLWQAAWGIPMNRVTTHENVDRSHDRYDPRSWRWNRFDKHHDAAVTLCGFKAYAGPWYQDPNA